MSFNKYYRDELSFLREMGSEFARHYPEAAHFLSEQGSDPDVERLLEGFAFLTGRIRQKLDDELPEVTHALMQLLWPHYLRPVPPISLVEFSPSGGFTETRTVPRGIELASIPVEGTSCRFRTCYDVDVHPMRIESVQLEPANSGRQALVVRCALEGGVSTHRLALDRLRLHLSGDAAHDLYLMLCRHVHQIALRTSGDQRAADWVYPAGATVEAVGFGRDEALIPYPANAFDGYRLLQEYFTFPEKFLFVEIAGLESVRELPDARSFELTFILSKPPDDRVRLSKDSLRLNCTPAVNLVNLESEPLRVDHRRTEYRLRPAASNPSFYEIFSVDGASGWVQGTAEEREYGAFYSFRNGQGVAGNDAVYYQTHLRDAVIGDGTDVYVSFVNLDQEHLVPPTETVAFRLTCTNRVLAEQLRPGDITEATESSPGFARFQNISRVSRGIRPPLGTDLYWRLISHMALNYVSLASPDALRSLLELYNFQSIHDRQAGRANLLKIESVVGVESKAEDLLFGGTPLRGISTQIDLQENRFATEGDMFLFASVLNEFLSLYVSMNSFSQLTARGVQEGEVYRWPARIGSQIIL